MTSPARIPFNAADSRHVATAAATWSSVSPAALGVRRNSFAYVVHNGVPSAAGSSATTTWTSTVPFGMTNGPAGPRPATNPPRRRPAAGPAPTGGEHGEGGPVTEVDERVRAVCDLSVASVREEAGRHEYDGVLQDLSDAGVTAALARVGHGASRADPAAEAHLRAFEDGARIRFGDLRRHHRDPLLHLGNLDPTCYDRPYAPAAERDAARQRHLAQWPGAVDVAVRTLDAVAAAIAAACRRSPPTRCSPGTTSSRTTPIRSRSSAAKNSHSKSYFGRCRRTTWSRMSSVLTRHR